jgi:hypothetical protein
MKKLVLVAIVSLIGASAFADAAPTTPAVNCLVEKLVQTAPNSGSSSFLEMRQSTVVPVASYTDDKVVINVSINNGQVFTSVGAVNPTPKAADKSDAISSITGSQSGSIDFYFSHQDLSDTSYYVWCGKYADIKRKK